MTIDSNKKLVDYIKDRGFDNGMILLGMNTSLNVIGENKLEGKDYHELRKEIINFSLENNYRNIHLITTENTDNPESPFNKVLIKNYDRLEKDLQDFDVRLADNAYETKESIYSVLSKGFWEKKIDSVAESTKEWKEKYLFKKSSEKRFYDIAKNEEFLNYYVNEELKGLSVTKDEKRIRELLAIDSSEKSREVFSLLLIDKSSKVISKEDLFTGTLDRSSVYNREIGKLFLNDSKTSGVICLHNHPGGSLNPSEADIGLTKKLKGALKMIDKKLYDHFIVSRQGVTSMKELSDFKLTEEIVFDKFQEQNLNNKKRIDFRKKETEKELER